MSAKASSCKSNSAASKLVETTSTYVDWYDKEPGARLTPEVCSLFESYCGLRDEQLINHLYEVHTRAWNARPYPCVGQWAFLSPNIRHSPAFSIMLERLQAGQTIIDIGCNMGSDLRWLAAQGAPSRNMYGADIEPAFWDLGYNLYQDRDKFEARFLHTDILDPAYSIHKDLEHRADLVWLGSVLHLWDWKGQVKALKAIFDLARGAALIAGCQVGRVKGHEVKTGWKNDTKTMFFHDANTWQTLWAEVARETRTSWDVSARTVEFGEILPEKKDYAWMSPDARCLLFEARRIDNAAQKL